ncbi:hypothetical protein GCM10027299_23970 [Larkinella ripae]
MAAPSIQFTPPYDVHLVRGQTFQLISDGLTDPGGIPYVNLLTIDNGRPATYVDNHANHSYRFRFSFDETKAADFGIRIVNPIADVRKPDCRITLEANEPALLKNRIRNFYVFAEVTDTAGTPGTGDDTKNETALRIHIHNRIEEIWITPNPLTIYNGLYYRADLYARFDDNVVAKIGASHFKGNNGYGFRYNTDPAIAVTWTSDTPGLVPANSDTLRPQGLTGTHVLRAEATYNGISRQATADVIISEALTRTSTLRAELVTSSFSPGFSQLNEVPNILFLAEGFTAEQEWEFKVLVLDYVYDLSSKKITAPFNLLKHAINYWMVFIPSREGGVSTFGERRVTETTSSINLPQLKGDLIPFVENPGTREVANWGVQHLLYFTGLPARAEKTSSNPDLAEKWKATTNLSDAQVDALVASRTDLLDSWRSYAERRLPEVRDTALGITVNDYTAASSDSDFNMINLDTKRTHRDYLDDFFFNLRDTAGNVIGTTFIQSPFSTPDPAIPQGKDWDNIVIIVASNRGRAQNATGYMFSTIGRTAVDTLTGDLSQNRVSIQPVSTPFKLPVESKGTITHEICHSFGLGDEYGESPPLDSYAKKPVTDPAVSGWPFAQYTGDGSSLDTYGNIQARSDLEIPASDGTTRFNAFRIKWRYHRIRKCGIVTAVSVTQSTLTLILKPGQAAQFTDGNAVFIRKRRKDSYVYFLNDVSGANPVFIGAILSPDPVPAAFQTRMAVTAVDAAANTVTVETLVQPGDIRTLDLVLEPGKAAQVQVGQRVQVSREYRPGPIYAMFRSDTGELIQRGISPLLTVARVHAAANQLEVTIPADFPDFLKTLTANDAVVVYLPIDMPEGQRSANYPHAEVISQKVLHHLLADPVAFNADSGDREIIDRTTDTRIPGQLVPCCSKREKEVIGLYAGGARHHGGVYHPAAQCMMRFHNRDNRHTELCAVCRYTLINLIDPTRFAAFDTDYMDRKIYPEGL